jgi:hypothetical protein
VIFGHNQHLAFGGVPDQTGINPDDGSETDLWVIDPSEFDDEPVVIMVVVDERCTRRTSFKEWLRDVAKTPPDDAPFGRVFVPECASPRRNAAQRVQAWLDDEGIDARAVSYYPPHVW